jgi:hypothetical protein
MYIYLDFAMICLLSRLAAPLSRLDIDGERRDRHNSKFVETCHKMKLYSNILRIR